MPISQDRMIALTNAALDFQQALETLHNRANTLAGEVTHGEKTLAAAFNELVMLSNPQGLLANAGSTLSTIAVESRHWHRSAKRNAREKQRMRQRRGSSLGPNEASHTAPNSLSHGASAAQAPNIIRRIGLAEGKGDYLQGKPQAQAPKPTPAIDPAEVGKHLSPEAKAAIDAEIERTLHPIEQGEDDVSVLPIGDE